MSVRYLTGVYLSYRYDRDLVAFHDNVPIKTFKEAIKESLRLAIRPGYHTDFFKTLELDPGWSLGNKKGDQKYIFVPISISREDDEDVRELLAAAKYKRTSNLIKMALRFGLGPRYVVGFDLTGDDSINSVVGKDNLFYIQKSPTKVIVKVVEGSTPAKDKPAESAAPVLDMEKEPVKTKAAEEPVKEEPVQNSSFALPGLMGGELSFGSDTDSSNNEDTFDDDDILSRLDSMM